MCEYPGSGIRGLTATPVKALFSASGDLHSLSIFPSHVFPSLNDRDMRQSVADLVFVMMSAWKNRLFRTTISLLVGCQGNKSTLAISSQGELEDKKSKILFVNVFMEKMKKGNEQAKPTSLKPGTIQSIRERII